MNYFITIDLLQLAGASKAEMNNVQGYFIPSSENNIQEQQFEDGRARATLAINAREASPAYLEKCQGAKPSHLLELKEDKTKEHELFTRIQTELQKSNPAWKDQQPSECEDLRKAIYKAMNEYRRKIGKMYSSK